MTRRAIIEQLRRTYTGFGPWSYDASERVWRGRGVTMRVVSGHVEGETWGEPEPWFYFDDEDLPPTPARGIWVRTGVRASVTPTGPASDAE